MEISDDQSSSLSSETQTDFVNSPILWQCLYVLQHMPEFRNLTYRITKTWNDVEIILVYREGVIGVFGPPVDTITLTLDPKGKCLLSIPFKPVQRVSIVSPENGHIEIATLLAVLRMVAGKGYLFCPGLPERFLAGKACGKFVVLHKVPFKRYQSSTCPVYYQAHQQANPKSSLCALCPRCMQAAKWIQSLPYFSANGAAKTLQQPAQPGSSSQQQIYQRSAIQDVTTKSNVPTLEASHGYILSSAPTYGFMSHGIMNGSSIKTVPGVSEIVNIYQNSNGVHQKTGNMDMNGNSQIAEVSKNNAYISGQSGNTAGVQSNSVNEKLMERKSFLRSLLQERSKNKLSAALNVKTEITGGEASINKTNEQSSNKIKKGKQRHKNVCHYCKKTFSTPANLMNHFQRHEAVSGSWQKQFKERRIKKNYARSSSLMRMLCWRLKSLWFQHRKRPICISETSLRLLLKYLDDMIPFLNGATSLKQIDPTGIKQEVAKVERKMDIHNIEKTENEALDAKFSLKRHSSGQSVMQTLLEAAAIAGADQENVSSPTVSSSSSVVASKILEGTMPTISQTPPTPTYQMELVEANVPEKRRKKSAKLKSKRASSKNRKIKDKDVNNETVATKISGNSVNHSFLTNLDLLSDVSMQTAVLETSAKTENSLNFSHQLPTSLYPKMSRSSASYTTTSSSFLNNVSENNASFIKEPKTNSPLTIVNGSKTAAIPYLPPLLFARTEPSTSASFLCPSPKQSNQQLVSPTLLRHGMVVCEKQPLLSSSLAAAFRSTPSPTSDCGAIDLSKPKLSQSIKNVPFIVDKNLDLPAFSGLPHAQMVSYANPEIVSFLKRTTNSADVNFQGQNETQPVPVAATNNKSAKSDLQFPSTGNTRSCKSRKGGKNTGHLHTVVDTSSCSTLPGDSSLVQSDEIHCSYKWTGSGGMVKEHTQMVRELVPSHIMANFLSKPWSSSAATQPISASFAATQPISASLYNSSKLPVASPQIVMSQLEQLSPKTPHHFSLTQAALNLSKSKPVDAAHLNNGVSSGGSKKQTLMISTPVSPAANHTLASPSSTNAKSSNVNIARITNHHAAHHPATPDIQDHPNTNSSHKMLFKDINFSNSSSMLLGHTSSTSTTVHSATLSSVLSQRADRHDYKPGGIIGSISHCGRLPGFLTNQINTPDNFELSGPRNSYIKPEPDYSQNLDPQMIDMPVKEENVDLDIVHGNKFNENSDSLPTNLVLDMSPDSTSKDETKTLTLGGHFNSEKADLISQKGSVICDS